MKTDYLLDIVTAPWAIQESKLLEIRRIYLEHVAGVKLSPAEIEARIGQVEAEPKPYRVDRGVAIVPAVGVMARRASFMQSISGGASHDIFRNQITMAANDADVKSIVLEISSPGGTVAGTEETAALIREVVGVKPVIALADGIMASAAYWIGAAASEVYATEHTATIGSIGVVATHVDMSKAREAAGIVVEEITAGRYKRIPGDRPLDDEDRAVIQAQVDAIYVRFVDDVATYLGTTPAVVLDQMADGRVFIADEALERGMLTGIERFEQVMDIARQSTITSIAMGRAPAQAKLDKPNSEKDPKMKVTAEQLKADHPEVYEAVFNAGAESVSADVKQKAAAQVEERVAAATENAATAERERVLAIQDAALPGCEKIVAAAIADPKCSAEMAAVQILKHEKAARAAGLSKAQSQAPAAMPAFVDPAAESREAADSKKPVAPSGAVTEESLRAHWKDHGPVAGYVDVDNYVAAEMAISRGHIRIRNAGRPQA